MSIKFIPETHSYISLKEEEQNIKWTSVTSVISKFKQPFDAHKIATKVSKQKNSKWYGLSVASIKEIWDKEAKRATDLGTWYHNQREADLCGHDTILVEDKHLPIIKPIEKNGEKYSPEQVLQEGIYPEHFVYLKSAGLCGQSDLVEVVNGKINIIDFKSNKEIKFKSFTNWDGVSQKMLSPLQHLDDCSFNHYSLQLSMYMYMMLKHNFKLEPGKMHLHHIIFEEQTQDEFGYPITKLDVDKNPIVKEVIKYEVPYLKNEVVKLLNHIKNNK